MIVDLLISDFLVHSLSFFPETSSLVTHRTLGTVIEACLGNLSTCRNADRIGEVKSIPGCGTL